MSNMELDSKHPLQIDFVEAKHYALFDPVNHGATGVLAGRVPKEVRYNLYPCGIMVIGTLAQTAEVDKHLVEKQTIELPAGTHQIFFSTS